MGPVEQALIILRKAPCEDVQPEVGIAAIGNRRHNGSVRFQNRRHLLQHRQRIAQVLEDVAANGVGKTAAQRREPTVEIRFHQLYIFGKTVAVAAGSFDADNLVSALRKHLREVPCRAANIEDPLAAALGRQRIEQERMAAVRAGLIGITSCRAGDHFRNATMPPDTGSAGPPACRAAGSTGGSHPGRLCPPARAASPPSRPSRAAVA